MNSLVFSALVLCVAVSCSPIGLPPQPDNPGPFGQPDDDDSFLDDDDTAPPYEGDDPGECSDGADNDQDGLFDCDDPGCFGSPDCQGDDDDAADDDDDTADDDDDTAPDDDDTAPDDDDTAPPTNAPVIDSITAAWLSSTQELQFTILVTDANCDLGNPTLHWLLDGVAQQPAGYSASPPLTCNGTLYFTLSGLTAGYTYTFAFALEDSAGDISDFYTITETAS